MGVARNSSFNSRGGFGSSKPPDTARCHRESRKCSVEDPISDWFCARRVACRGAVLSKNCIEVDHGKKYKLTSLPHTIRTNVKMGRG